MAFDAGMLACALHEIKEESLGARVEKVYQPERDEIVLQIRSHSGGKRLLINAGANNPRIGFTEEPKENPQNPPMFCMLLRKHLQGSKLISVQQEGFERVASLGFETRDEMGYECIVYLKVEIMGKYSNLIFTSKEGKILAVLKTVDFTTSSMRQVLPGMKYEMPPAQDKHDPRGITKEDFSEILAAEGGARPGDKFLMGSFLGISAAVAREVNFRATGAVDTPVSDAVAPALWEQLRSLMDSVAAGDFSPTLILQNDAPVEYAFCDLSQYGETFVRRSYESVGQMLDVFFGSRDRQQRVHQRANDVQKLLSNALSRVSKKLEIQRAELAECSRGEEYKKQGDLITAHMYLLKRGQKTADLPDYGDYDENGNPKTVRVTLDERLSPAANAQRYYKKYNKAKNAKVELSRQIELDLQEITYLNSVMDSLCRSESPTDLGEIRQELHRSGYASRVKDMPSRKQPAPTVAHFRTSGGYEVLCGKNNTQNEYITFKLAAKTDYWFHAKNVPGSHVVLVCHGEEPSEKDFTQAAEIAAFHSGAAGGQNIAVDYTLAKNIKKPPASKPGLVIYHTNWTAYVTPSSEEIRKLRVK